MEFSLPIVIIKNITKNGLNLSELYVLLCACVYVHEYVCVCVCCCAGMCVCRYVCVQVCVCVTLLRYKIHFDF